jgi:hypothetical protein
MSKRLGLATGLGLLLTTACESAPEPSYTPVHPLTWLSSAAEVSQAEASWGGPVLIASGQTYGLPGSCWPARLLGDAGTGRKFGDDADGRKFGDDADGRKFGDDADGRKFGDDADGRKFGDDADGRKFGDDADGRKFGDDADGRKFGDDADGRKFGDDAAGRQFGGGAQALKCVLTPNQLMIVIGPGAVDGAVQHSGLRWAVNGGAARF